MVRKTVGRTKAARTILPAALSLSGLTAVNRQDHDSPPPIATRQCRRCDDAEKADRPSPSCQPRDKMIQNAASASLLQRLKLRYEKNEQAFDIAAFVSGFVFDIAMLDRIDALVCNAGTIVRKSLFETTLAEWQHVIDVNLTGATLMVREVVARMIASEARPGVIVNMSSIARHGNRGQSNYVAAKAALAANTLTWAREFAAHGIRTGAIAPGMIETPMTVGMNAKARDALVATVPVGRIGTPEDIWQAVRFVLECDYFNGRTIDVDGGLSM